MKRIFLFLAMASFKFTIWSQNPVQNLEKYKYYKERFANSFIHFGRHQGESVPFQRRTFGEQNNENIDLHLSLPDNPLHLGSYIAALATEFKLLTDNTQNTDETLMELCLALDAVNRLDLLSNVLMGGLGFEKPLSQWPDPAGNLDGFLLRDDVPDNFMQNHPNLMAGNGYAKIPSTLVLGDYIQTGHHCNFSGPGSRNEFSKDHIIGLLSGLVIAKKCIEITVSSPPSFGTFIDGETNVNQEVYNIMDRILTGLRDHQFKVYNEYCDNCAFEQSSAGGDPCGLFKGGNAMEYAFPLASVANEHLGHPFSFYFDPFNSFSPDLLFCQQLWTVLHSNLADDVINSRTGEDEKHARRELKHVSRLLALTNSLYKPLSTLPWIAFYALHSPLVLLPHVAINIDKEKDDPAKLTAINWIFHGFPYNYLQPSLIIPDPI